MLDAENWMGELPPTIREAIAARSTIVDLPAGATIKRAGDPPEALFNIVRGHVRLNGLHADGRKFLILVYRPGNSFGETPMVARRPFNHTTVTMTDTRLRRLREADFWELYHLHSAIPEALCRKFARNSSRLLDGREERASHRLRQQISAVFLNLADHCGERFSDGSVAIFLPVTQVDIAEHLDVTRQAVQREISAIKVTGLLARRDGCWLLPDITSLRRGVIA